MSAAFDHLFESETIAAVQRAVDSISLHRGVGSEPSAEPLSLSSVAVAAQVATASVFDQLTLDDVFRADRNPEIKTAIDAALANWRAVMDSGRVVDWTDLIMYLACGALARQQTEMRSFLSRSEAVSRLVADPDEPAIFDWTDTCQQHIARAIVMLVKQASQEDAVAGGNTIKSLIELQKLKQDEVSGMMADPRKDTAYAIVGLYHLGHATIRTSNYLISGRASELSEKETNFEPELRRLLLKAEEIVEAGGSPEHVLWIRAAGTVLWSVFDQSIWRQALGLSEPIDRLVAELTSRPQPIFSLLPSQQEALQNHLLDRAQVAVVLQMPTSAGKTLLAEFYILQAFEAYKENTKVLFVAPTRALCTQTHRTLVTDISPLGIPVQQASSAFEEDPFEKTLIAQMSSGVCVATPEKVDLLLRSHPDWFSGVKLVVIDEAHLLGDSERGVRLELLLANIRREQPTVRFLMLTPFIENALEIARWLGGHRGAEISVRWRPARVLLGLATHQKSQRRRSFSIEWKEPFAKRSPPPPLQIEISAKTPLSNALDKVVALNASFGKLGLTLGMFPSSKTYAEKAALMVAMQQESTADSAEGAMKVALALASAEYGEKSTLVRCLQRRTAFHHASLSPELRFLVEELSRTKQLRFLAATTTLAQGINFPVASVLFIRFTSRTGRAI